MRTVGHIINPVVVPETSDLFVAQPITFESMRVARDAARGRVEVNLYSAQYRADRALVPNWYDMTPDLDRSVLDVATFETERKLPLIEDILDRVYEVSDAEYFVYTNVDISLLPHFYLSVNALIERGFDALVINRRTIPAQYLRPDELSLMYAQAGKPHPGYDCFVFRREVYPEYFLGHACIGAGRIGQILMLNLMAHAARFELFTDLHLTFHLGDDQSWRAPARSDYLDHNERQLHSVLAHYEGEEWVARHPLYARHVARMRRSRAASDLSSHGTALARLVQRFAVRLRKS